MKMNFKKILALLLVVVTVSLSACTSVGLIKAETNEEDTVTAYLYSKKGEDGVEYCFSLLDKDKALDVESEPNVYKSLTEYDFEWNGDMIAVIVNESKLPKEPIIEVGDVTVVFGHLTGVTEQ